MMIGGIACYWVCHTILVSAHLLTPAATPQYPSSLSKVHGALEALCVSRCLGPVGIEAKTLRGSNEWLVG